MDTKYCPACETTKPFEDFSKNKAKPDGLQSVCKVCKKLYGQRHYQANKETYAANSRAYQKRLRNRVHVLKESGPCVDCGTSFPYYVMQYDHIGSDKIAAVSSLLSQCAAWERIEAEIAKCELVCANCHCERTHQRLVDSGAEEE